MCAHVTGRRGGSQGEDAKREMWGAGLRRWGGKERSRLAAIAGAVGVAKPVFLRLGVGVSLSPTESGVMLVHLVRETGQMFAQVVAFDPRMFACLVAILRDMYREIGRLKRECNQRTSRIRVRVGRELPINTLKGAYATFFARFLRCFACQKALSGVAFGVRFSPCFGAWLQARQ